MENHNTDYRNVGNTEYRPLFNNTSNNLMDRPLFGIDTPRDKIMNIVVGFVTAFLVLITVILSFTLHEWSIWGLNVYFSICIIFSCTGHLLLVQWYRQGDLDPKFRNLIYLNSLTIIMLCICAMCYITLARDEAKKALNETSTTTTNSSS